MGSQITTKRRCHYTGKRHLSLIPRSSYVVLYILPFATLSQNHRNQVSNRQKSASEKKIIFSPGENLIMNWTWKKKFFNYNNIIGWIKSLPSRDSQEHMIYCIGYWLLEDLVHAEDAEGRPEEEVLPVPEHHVPDPDHADVEINLVSVVVSRTLKITSARSQSCATRSGGIFYSCITGSGSKKFHHRSGYNLNCGKFCLKKNLVLGTPDKYYLNWYEITTSAITPVKFR